MRRAQRVATAFCLAGAVLLTSACGGSGAAGGASTSRSGAPAVQVDEGLLTVDVTIQRNWLDQQGELTDEQIIQAAKDQGWAAVVNPDRSVTYTMTRRQQREALDRMRTSMKESAAQMVDDPNNSFTAIEVADDLTVFTVKVDKSRYSQMESLYALAFYMGGAVFQQFSGVPTDQVDVKVTFVDDASGDVLNTASLREWLDRESQEATPR